MSTNPEKPTRNEDLFENSSSSSSVPHNKEASELESVNSTAEREGGEHEKQGLYLEATKKWHIPRKLIEVIAVGAIAAATQGMDESTISGATLFYPKAFGVTEMKNADLIEGLVNSAPYLCCSVIACWTSDYWNRHLGFVNNWWHLFIARFFLGFGIGVKSATVPAYAAECTPKHVRGALVMLWQFFTAVGIMFGFVSALAFYYVPHKSFESPRWLMGKERHKEAFESLKALRFEEIAAARDCFYQYVLLKEEGTYDIPTWKRLIQMFTIRRNRNGAIGSWIVMFMQQFCGINVIAYYASSIFIKARYSEISALLASWGFAIYSSSEGPVPFTYSAEAFPLYIRDLGMSWATATCWFFNFILAFTWPRLQNAFTPTGAFGWYAAWNVIGFFLVLWFLPETKGLTLEELDDVFAVPMYEHAVYRTKELLNGFQRVILRRNIPPMPPLYHHQRMAVTNPEWNDKTEVDHIE
ncbi:Sugar (and other) transporter family protein [Candida albicans]|uniref:Sugar (And other) transporter family protein n=1 Tax=Candida albicans TaxID=5476 RepID=A0A8H6F660_CANAX|nr:Sugar (and other) transporter family protein [Candida albicans]